MNDKIETLILLLCKIPQVSQVKQICREHLGIAEEDIDEMINEARQYITITADYNRDTEIGKSLIRLEDLYKKANEEKEYKQALAIEKARIALLRLNSPSAVTDTSETINDSKEIEEIRLYLEPLKLAAEGTPVAELVRLAVLKLTQI
jgi:hypothetical protein